MFDEYLRSQNITNLVDAQGQNHKVLFMYLGRKGAGELFQEYLTNSKLPYVFNAGFCSRKHATDEFRQIVMELPVSTIGLLNLWKKERFVRKVVQIILDHGFSHVVIPMAHPWDLAIQKRLRLDRIRFTRILHDAVRHPGDLWPRKRSIRFLYENSRIICLSHFTKNKIAPVKGWIRVAAHPNVWPDPTGKVLSSDSYDLIIGRHKRYQNTYMIASWWSNKVSRCFPERELWIVGRIPITLKIRLRKLKNSKIVIISDWVTNQDFVDYLGSANTFLCLYSEASQSGNLELAKYLNVPALVSNVGALPEQVQLFERGSVVDLTQEESWLKTYNSLKRKGQSPFPCRTLDELETVIESSILERA